MVLVNFLLSKTSGFLQCQNLTPMHGWMTCEFTYFSTVFHPYQDDGRLIMKGCCAMDSVYG